MMLLFNQEYDKLFLNFNGLTPSEIKAHAKLESLYSTPITVSLLLSLDVKTLENIPHIGKNTVENVTNIIEKVKHELQKSAPIEKIKNFESYLLRSEHLRIIPIDQLDKVTIEDIDRFLWNLDDRTRDILMFRWGYNTKQKTLQELGDTFNIERERVRQIESKATKIFLNSLRICPKVFWYNVSENLSPNFDQELPLLRRSFESSEILIDFIETCSQVKKRAIKDVLFPIVKNYFLDRYFSNIPSPYTENELVEELMSLHGFNGTSARIIINQLIETGVLKKTQDKIKPQMLSQLVAVEHTLSSSDFKNGLPWVDIARIINANGYMKKAISETRLIPALNRSDRIMLCDRGAYKHVKFVNFDGWDIEGELIKILMYFDKLGVSSFKLYDYFMEEKAETSPNSDFWILRHIVRNFGEKHQIFFQGKSQSDIVSLVDEGISLTTKDSIYQKLVKAKKSKTYSEIANSLKTKSIEFARILISELINEGKVVRVDYQQVCATEYAFKNINQIKVIETIKDILKENEGKLIEMDFIREYVNRELDYRYSKFFYSSFIDKNMNIFEVNKVRHLISSNSIEYGNLRAIARAYCDLSKSNSENVKILSRHVVSTVATLSVTVTNLKLSDSAN